MQIKYDNEKNDATREQSEETNDCQGGKRCEKSVQAECGDYYTNQVEHDASRGVERIVCLEGWWLRMLFRCEETRNRDRDWAWRR